MINYQEHFRENAKLSRKVLLLEISVKNKKHYIRVIMRGLGAQPTEARKIFYNFMKISYCKIASFKKFPKV